MKYYVCDKKHSLSDITINNKNITYSDIFSRNAPNRIIMRLDDGVLSIYLVKIHYISMNIRFKVDETIQTLYNSATYKVKFIKKPNAFEFGDYAYIFGVVDSHSANIGFVEFIVNVKTKEIKSVEELFGVPCLMFNSDSILSTPQGERDNGWMLNRREDIINKIDKAFEKIRN